MLHARIICVLNNKAWLVIVCLLTLTCSLGIAQSPQLNNLKYWNYRHRLINNFTHVGPNQGQSLIASARGGGHGVNKEQFYYGDQTILLGQYIAVLALEFNLLSKDNQSTTQTVRELFYALYALNRLDLNAESLFRKSFNGEPNPQPSDLNGFFIRDDVDYEFYNNAYAHLTSGEVDSKAELKNSLNRILSDWISDSKRSYETKYAEGGDAEMSQDQVHYLMFGLAMVQKFVPAGVTFKDSAFQDGEKDLLQESSNVIERIVGHINRTTYGESLWTHFLITNPARDNQLTKRGGSVGQGPTDFGLPVVNGLWSYGFGEYCGKIQGHKKKWFKLFQPTTGFAAKPDSNSYCHNKFSTYTMRMPWILQELLGVPYVFGHDNCHQFALMLALKGFPNTYPAHFVGYRDNELQHIPLIKQVLYGGMNPVPKRWYEGLLNAAPFDGPYKFVWSPSSEKHDASTYEWSASDRIVHSNQRGNGGITGEFPGLDYMLYYNLYCTIHSKAYAPFYRID